MRRGRGRRSRRRAPGARGNRIGRSYTPPVRTSREALWIVVWSRAAVWIGALFALLTFLPNGMPNAIHRDDPTLIHDLGWLTDIWARWDSVWFIRIAHHGYDVASGAPAFYPLYPGLVAVAGRICGGHYVLGACWSRSLPRSPHSRCSTA